MKFSFQNLGNRGEDKNGRRQTTFDFENEKSSILAKYTKKFCLSLKPKVVYLRQFLSSPLFPKFYIFWTQTYRIWTKLFK